MTTSRTGTAVYLRNRKRALHKAQADGITHCPGYVDTRGIAHPCGVELDYDVSGLPNSAEADHVVPHKFGGTDDVENLTVLCRKCNVEKGDGSRTAVVVASAADFPTSREW